VVLCYPLDTESPFQPMTTAYAHAAVAAACELAIEVGDTTVVIGSQSKGFGRMLEEG